MDRDVIEPVDKSLNVTISGDVPSRGVVFVKSATGATGAGLTVI